MMGEHVQSVTGFNTEDCLMTWMISRGDPSGPMTIGQPPILWELFSVQHEENWDAAWSNHQQRKKQSQYIYIYIGKCN